MVGVGLLPSFAYNQSPLRFYQFYHLIVSPVCLIYSIPTAIALVQVCMFLGLELFFVTTLISIFHFVAETISLKQSHNRFIKILYSFL